MDKALDAVGQRGKQVFRRQNRTGKLPLRISMPLSSSGGAGRLAGRCMATT
jgi:hypothetical protein